MRRIFPILTLLYSGDLQQWVSPRWGRLRQQARRGRRYGDGWEALVRSLRRKISGLYNDLMGAAWAHTRFGRRCDALEFSRRARLPDSRR